MGITYFPPKKQILLATHFSYTTTYNEVHSCNVYLTQYPNGQNCIRLEDNIYGEPIAHATASVNLYANDIVHQKACDDHVVIKDYCENAGMLAQLQAAGIVGETILHINGIHSGLHLCALLAISMEAQNELELEDMNDEWIQERGID